jgi:hypothetical protein
MPNLDIHDSAADLPRRGVSRAMVKLHAHDRAKLVVFAYEAGLVVPRRAAVLRAC